jgi:hypothetical protein
LVMIRGQVDSSHAPSRLYLFRAPRLALASLGRMIAVQW